VSRVTTAVTQPEEVGGCPSRKGARSKKRGNSATREGKGGGNLKQRLGFHSEKYGPFYLAAIGKETRESKKSVTFILRKLLPKAKRGGRAGGSEIEPEIIEVSNDPGEETARMNIGAKNRREGGEEEVERKVSGREWARG